MHAAARVCLDSPLTLALGGTGEGIGAWAGTVVLLYQAADWLGASVAEPCVTAKGRHDAGPVGCEVGMGYTQYLRPPARVSCHTSYAAINRSATPIAARGVAFLQPRGPLTVSPLFGGGSPSVYVAPLPRDGRDGRALAAELDARNVTLALIAAAPRDPSEVGDAVLRPCCGVHAMAGANNNRQQRPWCNPQRFLNGWKPRARLPERHPTADPIREFAKSFVAGLVASSSPSSLSTSHPSPARSRYVVAHWRVELMDRSQAHHCASWLHNVSARARAARGLPEATPLVLMSDAPDASLCSGGGEQGAAQACKGWRPDERGYNASAHYGGSEVRAALAWLKQRGWHKADETAASSPLLRSSNLARFLAEYEMAVSASLFVSCSAGPCWRCSAGRRSADAIVTARSRAGRPNVDWQTGPS